MLSLPPDFKLVESQENVYVLTGGGRSYQVKWIPEGDKLGLNEITVNTDILLGSAAPAPRLVFVTKADGGRVAAWEKIEGTDLRVNNRHALPAAFRVLGEFHRAHRFDGPVYSNITERSYPTIRDMLPDELDFHCCRLPEGLSARLRRRNGEPGVLAALEAGYPTMVHGDFHPGNIIVNDTGIFFLDWAYAHHGLSLLDLDYIQSIELECGQAALPWWTVGPTEAEPVLAAYFESCGLEHPDIAGIQRAVMLHAELRSYGDAQRKENNEGAAISLRNIDRLLNT
jgi:Ser/Thr protein kinase RdoA (MazF antagonist)